jgi:hypothetical protein
MNRRDDDDDDINIDDLIAISLNIKSFSLPNQHSIRRMIRAVVCAEELLVPPLPHLLLPMRFPRGVLAHLHLRVVHHAFVPEKRCSLF